MFSGIVETIGNITQSTKENECVTVSILPNMVFSDLKIGDSVSVNGVCLTVINIHQNIFDVAIVQETLHVTNLNNINKNTPVNLERSIKLSDRLGGHYVQGHIDCVGRIMDIHDASEGSIIITIQFPVQFKKYIVNKGYIALDGMSLTVIRVIDDLFTITLIPHTKKTTIAKEYKIGTTINIECDILSKYVENMVRASQ